MRSGRLCCGPRAYGVKDDVHFVPLPPSDRTLPCAPAPLQRPGSAALTVRASQREGRAAGGDGDAFEPPPAADGAWLTASQDECQAGFECAACWHHSEADPPVPAQPGARLVSSRRAAASSAAAPARPAALSGSPTTSWEELEVEGCDGYSDIEDFVFSSAYEAAACWQAEPAAGGGQEASGWVGASVAAVWGASELPARMRANSSASSSEDEAGDGAKGEEGPMDRDALEAWHATGEPPGVPLVCTCGALMPAAQRNACADEEFAGSSRVGIPPPRLSSAATQGGGSVLPCCRPHSAHPPHPPRAPLPAVDYGQGDSMAGVAEDEQLCVRRAAHATRRALHALCMPLRGCLPARSPAWLRSGRRTPAGESVPLAPDA